MEFCLWDAIDDSSNFQRNFSTGEVEVEPASSTIRRNTVSAAITTPCSGQNCPVDSFDTTRDAFCGVYGGPADPQAVRAGHCSGSIAHGWAPVGALHIHVTLPPAKKEASSSVWATSRTRRRKSSRPGVINKTRAHAMMARYATDAQVDAARRPVADHWDRLLSTYHLESGDEKLDRMVNIWNQYQCMVTFNMSRSASYLRKRHRPGHGLSGLLPGSFGLCASSSLPCPERILDIAATQFEDGSAYHQYQPLTKKGQPRYRHRLQR